MTTDTLTKIEQRKQQLVQEIEQRQNELADLDIAERVVRFLSAGIQQPEAVAAKRPEIKKVEVTAEKRHKVGKTLRVAANAGLPDVFTTEALSVALKCKAAQAVDRLHDWVRMGFVEQSEKGWKKTERFPASIAPAAA